MSRPTRAEINLKALHHNLGVARQAASNSRVMAVIKANGYGHGMIRVAHALNDADAFAVATIEEAINLREAGIIHPLLLLEGPLGIDDIALMRGFHLQSVIHTVEQLEMLEQASAGRALPAWLKIDTGMHRLGFSVNEVRDVHRRMSQCQNIADIKFMMHFACADEDKHAMSQQQLDNFDKAIAGIAAEQSLANSAAVLSIREAHADWVRPGIMLYGSSPLQGKSASELGLQAVMTLKSSLIAVRDCKKGDQVGYGAAWTCSEDMRIGVACIGYGDGYPRHAPSGTPVLVKGQRAALAGRVSMDMICIDLRNIKDAAIGDEVICWGDDLSVDEIAQHAGTISYELLCGVTTRVPYIER
jgi:alanine racemase